MSFLNCTFLFRALLVFSIMQVQFSLAQDRSSGRSFATRSEVLATNGMVATNHPLATQIGLDVLKKEVLLWMRLLQQTRFWGLPIRA